jgi:DNA-binding MarR family transcriptional regulator
MDNLHQNQHQQEVQNPASIDCNKECLSFALKRCSRAITQIYDQNLSTTGIRSTQFNLLTAIGSTEMKTLTQLAKILVMDRTTLTRNMKPLEKMALIQTMPAKDKRSKSYALTEKGREVLSQAAPIWQKIQAQVKDIFPGEMSLEEFIEFLTKIVEKSRRI